MEFCRFRYLSLVILDLGACLDSVLEVCISFRLEMVKVEVLKILTGSGLFDIRVVF